ncbi:MAG TPA: c-type cytochrome domain-containing protein, partial [Candidatus Dormibacteraeota bacterium]|nr:c-type cytochrome domain-containing protein [Candidatus Dormibacteraeota bacterium]
MQPQTAAVQVSTKQATTSSQKIEFDRDIKPILESSCVTCHGPETHQGQLRLDSEAAILDGGVSGKVIIPGNGQESFLVKRLLGAGGAPRMPMGGEPLSTEKIALIRAWIDQGLFTTASSAADIRSGASATTHDLPASPQSTATHPKATGGSVVFATQIRPILAARCYPCHGLDVQQNGLRLDSLQAILAGSTNGKVVIPGDSQKSHLVRRLLGLERPQMPYGAPPLSAEQIELVRKWIEEGAAGPDSVEPVAVA